MTYLTMSLTNHALQVCERLVRKEVNNHLRVMMIPTNLTNPCIDRHEELVIGKCNLSGVLDFPPSRKAAAPNKDKDD